MRKLVAEVECALGAQFARIEENAARNTEKVLAAFSAHRVSDSLFAGTTGYGYDDAGRDTLERIYADVFEAEDALVRIQFVNGTHAIACALYGTLAPGDTLLSVTGAPYDTLQTVITGEENGTLRSYGISYRELSLNADGTPDLPAISAALTDPAIKTVFLQRSRGYTTRPALSLEAIEAICQTVKMIRPEICIVVDNCYGEFVETREPTALGADLIAGSLIKNPGGGLAPSGGYIAGKKKWVEAAAARLTVPGIGRECGSSLGQNRALYQGFFLAPHVTAQALKTAVFCAGLLERLGFTVSPKADEIRHDIIQTVALGTPALVQKFCKGIQSGAPVDSFVTPEPWAMPGYDSPVIMAAGAFIQGASIELSADAPMREPYLVYLQGGLTYESGKAGILKAVSAMQEDET